MLKLAILGLATAFTCVPIGLLDLEDLLHIGTEP